MYHSQVASRVYLGVAIRRLAAVMRGARPTASVVTQRSHNWTGGER
jgi:hypothetical protein